MPYSISFFFCTKTHSQPQATGTLFIQKSCEQGDVLTPCKGAQFTITVTGNNPHPSTLVFTCPTSPPPPPNTFSCGSALVTLGPGTYTVKEMSVSGVSTSFLFDCKQVGDSHVATGAIRTNERQDCAIDNRVGIIG
jgi:hypothetical protein